MKMLNVLEMLETQINESCFEDIQCLFTFTNEHCREKKAYILGSDGVRQLT